MFDVLRAAVSKPSLQYIELVFSRYSFAVPLLVGVYGQYNTSTECFSFGKKRIS